MARSCAVSSPVLVSLLAVAILALPRGLPAAGAPPDTLAARVAAAMVEVHAPYLSGRGVLVADARTVLFPDGFLSVGRPLRVRLQRGPDQDVVAAAHPVEDLSPEVTVLRLERALAAEPLPVAADAPPLGAVVRVALPGPDGVELSETTITARSPTRLTVAGSPGHLAPGWPVLDGDGRVIAVLHSEDGGAVRVDAALARARTTPHDPVAGPLFGVRFGAAGGTLPWGFLLQLDLGVRLWDQLGVAARVDFSVADERTRHYAPRGSVGPGVAHGTPWTIGLALELKYRLLLDESGGMATWLSFAVAGQYLAQRFVTDGVALFGAPGCDPAREPCAVLARGAPDDDFTHGVGALFGVDLTLGGLTFGYRFAPGATGWQMPEQLHQVTAGFGFL